MRQDLPSIGVSAKIVKRMGLRAPVWALETGVAAMARPVADGVRRMGALLCVAGGQWRWKKAAGRELLGCPRLTATCLISSSILTGWVV
jgi:hypothetical protein